MRDKQFLYDFENMKTLFQFLYLDEANSIIVHNTLNVQLRLRMDDKGNVWCKNMNFPDVNEVNYTGNMTVNTVAAIIEQLKTVPAVEYPNAFESRWEEIETLCLTQLSLNFK